MYSKVAKYIFGLGLTYYALRKYGWEPINAIAYASFWVFLTGLCFELFLRKYGKDIAPYPKEEDPYWAEHSNK